MAPGHTAPSVHYTRLQGVKSQRRGQSSWEYRISNSNESSVLQNRRTSWAASEGGLGILNVAQIVQFVSQIVEMKGRGGGRQRETEKTKERQRQTRSQLLHLRKIAPSILTCQLWAVSLHSKFPSPYKLPLTWQWHWRWQWQCQWQWQWQWQCQWQWHATTCVSCFRPITTEIHRGSGHSSFFHRKYRHPATAVVVGGAINWTFCFVCTSQTGYCHNCGVRHQLQLLTAGLWCYRKKTNCHGCWYAVRNMFKAVNICDKSMFGDRTFRALFRRTPTVLHSQAMAQLRQIVSFITRGWVPFCFSGMRRTVLQAFNICFASQKGLYLIKIYFPFIVCVLLV